MKIGPIYVITDATLRPGASHLTLVQAALAGGADVIQLRDKPRAASGSCPAAPPLTTRALLATAREAGGLCRRAGTTFLVDDRVDVAWAADADGVHLGDDDLPLTVARALLGPHRLIGASADGIDDILARAAEGADYCGIGPVFPTATKSDTGPVLGLDALTHIAAAAPIPLVAIGGIGLEQIAAVAATGVHAVALVSAIWGARDPEAAIRQAREEWTRGRRRMT